MWIYFLSIIGALVFACFQFRFSRSARLFHKLPRPEPNIPILGNIFVFLRPFEKLWDLQEQFINFNSITALNFFNLWHIVIRDPDDIEIIMSSQKFLRKGNAYTFLYPWLKTGLLTSMGEKWRNRRKVLTPAFHFNILKKYAEISSDHSSKLVEDLKAQGDESVQSLLDFSSKYTLDIVCESALGVKLQDFDESQVKRYKKAIYIMGRVIIERILTPWINLDGIMNTSLFSATRRQKQALRTLHDFSGQVINNREEFHKSTNYEYLGALKDVESGESWVDKLRMGGKKNKLSFLDLLIAAERDGLIDREGIQEEVDTFMFEGHDTSGTAMAFTALLLANNKTCQDRAREEVLQVLKDSDDQLTTRELQKLDYLERCIKESLRLYPPVWIMTRTVTEELQLTNHLIPAYSEVFMMIFDTHRDPNHWSEPEKFDPDRFLPNKCQKRHPFSYVPFSGGPRNCIGQKFAMMELKSIFARILQNYYLEPITKTSDVKVLVDIIIRTVKPMYVKFVKIQHST